MQPDHEYHSLTVVDVVDETADTRSFVLEVPPRLAGTFAYAAGQFCTFRATIDGESVARCYSMSSSPDVGDPLTTTVKRVPEGRMSNWMNDTLAAGDTIEVMRPAGLFVLRPSDVADRRVRRRQRDHAGDLDREVGARHHRSADHARVREPRPRRGDLRRRARPVCRRARTVSSPSTSTSTPSGASSTPPGAPGSPADRDRRRLLRVRARALHGHGGGRPRHAARAVRTACSSSASSCPRTEPDAAAPIEDATVVIKLGKKQHELAYRAGDIDPRHRPRRRPQPAVLVRGREAARPAWRTSTRARCRCA